jgi:serine/threonine protein phosphatase 1
VSLLARLFGKAPPAAGPRLPAGYRLYALGDIHGRDDLLAELLTRIDEDCARRRPAKRILLFLGDLIDRGPASKEVVERLRTLRSPGTRMVFLAGNHEEVLLRILDGEAGLIKDWLKFGGAECLRSYGADPDRLRQLDPGQAIEAVRRVIPETHANFLRGFDDTFRAGDYLFVHAGIRPGIPLDEQEPADLRWIREPFLGDSREHGFVVVHGHTIRPQVVERSNRIGIDTGAYRHGVLTAMGLDGGERWFLQAGAVQSEFGQLPGNRADSSALDAVSGQSG